MKVRYYSEVLHKNFDSEDECSKAEAEYQAKLDAEEARRQKLADERKSRAKEVEDAYAAIVAAQKHYHELRNSFVKDYGSFHMTFSTTDDVFDILDNFFHVI